MKIKRLLKLNQKGFGHIEAVIAIAVIVVVGAAGVYISKHNNSHASALPSILFSNEKGFASIQANGTQEQQIADVTQPNNSGVWAQNGSTIIYLSPDKGIYSMSADGSNSQKIISISGNTATFAWSEATQKIAYVTDNTKGYPIGIYTVNVNGSNNKLIYKFPYRDSISNISLEYSPNGKMLLLWVFSSPTGTAIYTLNSNGTDLQTIASSTGTIYYYVNQRNAWSNDGSEIAYDESNDSTSPWTYTIYTMNIASKDAVSVFSSNDEGGILAPEWSPDGSTLAFIQSDFNNGTEWISLLLTTTLSNDSTQSVASYVGQVDGINAFDWSPDSSKLVYLVGNTSEKNEIDTVSSTGTNEKTIVKYGTYNSIDDWGAQ